MILSYRSFERKMINFIKFLLLCCAILLVFIGLGYLLTFGVAGGIIVGAVIVFVLAYTIGGILEWW